MAEGARHRPQIPVDYFFNLCAGSNTGAAVNYDLLHTNAAETKLYFVMAIFVEGVGVVSLKKHFAWLFMKHRLSTELIQSKTPLMLMDPAELADCDVIVRQILDKDSIRTPGCDVHHADDQCKIDLCLSN